jgi:hypothetical protein
MLDQPETKTKEGRDLQTDKHVPQSPLTGQFFMMTTFCIAFYESYLSMVAPSVGKQVVRVYPFSRHCCCLIAKKVFPPQQRQQLIIKFVEYSTKERQAIPLMYSTHLFIFFKRKCFIISFYLAQNIT